MPRRIVVIMAGGAGERFWPISRQNIPKQLLPLTGGESMLRVSVSRVMNSLVAPEDIYILTAARLAERIRQDLPELPPANVICEPVPRNTAPCLGLALAHAGFDGDDPPVMGVLTANHFIQNLDRFRSDIDTAYNEAAKGENLVTLGIVPTHPDTGFGYLEAGQDLYAEDGSQVSRVKRFCEKPDLETARQFLEAGNYLWNSGMFFWSAAALFRAFQQSMPQLAEGVQEMRQGIEAGNGDAVVAEIFPTLEKISIDYGVMERADNVVCVRSTFQWDDIGTWEAVSRINPADQDGNAAVGETLALDAKNNILYADTSNGAPIIAALGAENLIIVSSKDAVMVCRREDAQRVKELVAQLKQKNKEDLT